MRASWETRWEHMIEQGRIDELGLKGQEYYARHYGEEYGAEKPPYDLYEDYNDYEFDVEY